MKTSNQNIFLATPITLMASIVAATENSVNPDYRIEAENMVKLFSDLNSNSIVSVCEAPGTELISEEDNLIILNFMYSEFGGITSYTVQRFNSETSVYKIESSKGIYKMTLVLDSENRISAIDFSKVEPSQMSLAA